MVDKKDYLNVCWCSTCPRCTSYNCDAMDKTRQFTAAQGSRASCVGKGGRGGSRLCVGHAGAASRCAAQGGIGR